MPLCQIKGCPNITRAKNGICPNCFIVRKRLKQYLLNEGGMEYLKELLRNAFGKGLIDIDPETGEPSRVK